MAHLEASPDLLKESLFKFSLGDRCPNSVWAPLTLEPCGPQIYTIFGDEGAPLAMPAAFQVHWLCCAV